MTLSGLFCVIDKKSAVCEYFIASCEEDALRIWSVMAMSSKPMFEYLEDYELQYVRSLPDTGMVGEDVVLDGSILKRRIQARFKEAASNGET